ncbi:MAG: hypothetical protein IAF08_13840, partial [Rhizobacter sp.]|nr:hypothetical protein [Chlorobiales bacterium]
MLRKVIGRILFRLDKILLQTKKEAREEKNHAAVTIKDASLLLDECEIQNFRHDKTKIVIGEKTYVRGELLLFGHGGEIHIGHDCYIGAGTRIWSA